MGRKPGGGVNGGKKEGIGSTLNHKDFKNQNKKVKRKTKPF